MSSEPTSERRRPRADAARNRERLVEAARAAFTSDGEDTSLEGIARAAGVGIGTLYRAFPTREDLIAAVYRAELDAALDTVDDLLRSASTGARALRAFCGRYAEFVATKRGLAETVRVGALRGAAEAAGTRDRVNAAVQRFLDTGATDGSLRHDLLADDVTAALIGILLSTRDTTGAEQTGRLLDILLAGLSRSPARTA
ncbi:transcriptional regulator, TetR family [Curtobacterium sp. 314Chir4.1]|uniref:TetR/AcrR family transcriptional regulator n=1 Tax=Curtobacterium sp. 314Chir4.1 TaxID=1279028 RepID=UPI000BCA4906|nr:TetR/AcrR family transcriptional regulator [Curtobacterium sp. 314Chir4.1]SOC87360.1 transcriptional regulator, TetR family [Curtobacterium sp. 314Chir4.1]